MRVKKIPDLNLPFVDTEKESAEKESTEKESTEVASDRSEKIAADVPGKTTEEIKQYYESLEEEDISQTESGCVPLPSYNSSSEGSTSHASGEGAGKKGSGLGNYKGLTKASRTLQERRRYIAWTEHEHRQVHYLLCTFGKSYLIIFLLFITI